MEQAVEPDRALPALVDHGGLRVTVVFLLYLAQGVPLGMFNYALPAWLALNGASAGDIGFVIAAANLPWALKLINGVIMDRFAFLAMGRRRPWIIGSQAAMALLLVGMAYANPAPSDIMVIAGFAFAINVATSFQDVAVDGLACDIIPVVEQGRANALMFGAQALGTAGGTGVGGALLVTGGLGAGALVQAAFVAVVILSIVAVRERPGERLLPWHAGAASPAVLSSQLGDLRSIMAALIRAFAKRNNLLAAAGAFSIGTTAGLFAGLRPLVAADIVGWTGDELTRWSSIAGFAAGLGGALFVGVVIGWLGARRLMMLNAAVIAATAAAMLAAQPLWASTSLFVPLIFATLAFRMIANIAFATVAMRLVAPTVAASQFALFLAFSNLGYSAGGGLLGPVDGIGGIPALYAAIAACALTGLALVALTDRRVVGD